MSVTYEKDNALDEASVDNINEIYDSTSLEL